MTTDAFTEAARAEAERRHYPPHPAQAVVVEVIAATAFANGAEWGREQEPTNAEKYAAMDALGCELRVLENGQSTCDRHGGYATSDDVCEVVEVALSAAHAARRDEETR